MPLRLDRIVSAESRRYLQAARQLRFPALKIKPSQLPPTHHLASSIVDRPRPTAGAYKKHLQTLSIAGTVRPLGRMRLQPSATPRFVAAQKQSPSELPRRSIWVHRSEAQLSKLQVGCP